MSETTKAHGRRNQEGWFTKYAIAPGIDVGSGVDPISIIGFEPYDYQWVTDEHGNRTNVPNGRDAQTLHDVPDEVYMTVYASHILEHLPDPSVALRNWWRVLKPGGNLIVAVPHRDLYEKKKEKPSLWNPHTRPGGGGHLTFWLPETDEDPDTLSLRRIVSEALPDAEILDFRTVDAGYDYSLPLDVHPVGEYAIEIVLRKP